MKILILVDRSGSMTPEKKAFCVTMVESLVATIKESDAFEIALFDHEVLGTGIVQATPENKGAALFAFRVTFDDDVCGGTNIDAVRKYVVDTGADLVVIVGDGMW